MYIHLRETLGTWSPGGTIAQSSTRYDSKELETTWATIMEKMGRQIVLCSHDGLSLSSENGWTVITVHTY